VVGLNSLPGVLIQDVASSLDIHSTLSRWRKEVRELSCIGTAAGPHQPLPRIKPALSAQLAPQ
jgi:transposase-like protein